MKISFLTDKIILFSTRCKVQDTFFKIIFLATSSLFPLFQFTKLISMASHRLNYRTVNCVISLLIKR